MTARVERTLLFSARLKLLSLVLSSALLGCAVEANEEEVAGVASPLSQPQRHKASSAAARECGHQHHVPCKHDKDCPKGQFCGETDDDNHHGEGHDKHEHKHGGRECRPRELDDGNPCTIDSVDSKGVVHHTPSPAGTACEDGNACNGRETCDGQASCRAGTPPVLSDDNACTLDSCDPALGVRHTPLPAGTSCADGNPCNGSESCDSAGGCHAGMPLDVDDHNACTADRCDPALGAVHTPLPAGTSCADADQCNGAESCNGDGQCQTGAPSPSDDGNPCTIDACDPVAGVTHRPAPAGTSCDDGNPCNGHSACDAAGSCIAGAAPVLDDGNPCTADSCEPQIGVKHEPVADGSACGDHNPCNGAEACRAGVCEIGAPVALDDGNPCTDDRCEPATGVEHRPLPAETPCGDANVCNGTERCSAAGACEPGAPPALDDGNPCTVDSCEPGTGVWHLAAAAGTSCADADPCNGHELCDGAATCLPGTAPTVDDGNPCTIDSCAPDGSTAHAPAPAGTSCADSDPCNGNERCDDAGRCSAGASPPLDDGNPCTADSCDAALGILHQPLPAGTSCADADRCNGDEVCDDAGLCRRSAPSQADDGNPCTLDACDPATGANHSPAPAGTPCDDADPCNGVSTCDGSGQCTASPAPELDDLNPCTLDSCDPTFGVLHTPLPAGTACGDGNACNGLEACDGAALCRPGPPPVLDDGNPCTADTCDPQHGVVALPEPPSTGCSDGDPCNGAELCSGLGLCLPGQPPLIDDHNPCTLDSCTPELGLLHEPLPAGASCGNGDLCDGDELCDAAGVCQPGAPRCDDGNACNGVEECNPDGSCSATPRRLLTVTSPAAQSLTREASQVVSGTTHAAGPVVITITPGDVSTTQSGSSAPQPFSLTVPLIEGANQLTVQASAEPACSTSIALSVVRDSIAPVVTLELPERLALGEPGQASVTASDAGGVVEVRLRLKWRGEVVFEQALALAPFDFSFAAPEGALAGESLEVEALALDQAGNAGQASSTLALTASALVVGRVISDATGQPLGASVELEGSTATTRPDGRYLFSVRDSEALVRAFRAGFTSVERQAPVQFGVGSVVFDARLTPLAEPVLVNGADVTHSIVLASWDGQPIAATFGVPAAAFSGAVAVQLTPLSPQGLPGLLPPGWSPVAAFEARVAADHPNAAFPALQAPLTVEFSGLPHAPLSFVAYDRAQHAWRALDALDSTLGTLSRSLGGLGAFALLLPDANGPPLPVAGTLLPNAPAPAIPPNATAQGAGAPSTLSAGGGVTQGRVLLASSSALASGAVVSAALTETYVLSSGLTASTDTTLQDLVLYRAQPPSFPGAASGSGLLGAVFPIATSFSFGIADLTSGKLHVDVLAGREQHRGRIGGRAPVVVQHAGSSFAIAEQSLDADTLVDLERTDVSEFVPRSPELVPIAQVALDLSGSQLTQSGELRLSGLALAAEETPLLARLERIDRVAYPSVVALGNYDGSEWSFTSGDGFAGVLKEGNYVVYRTTLPLGFVAGTVRAAGAPVQALITAAQVPFVTIAGLDGSYQLPAPAGTASVTARVGGTNLVARGEASVTLGHTSQLDLTLVGELTTAIVSPSDGATAVPRTTQVTLATPIALDPTTLTEDNIRLFVGDPGDNLLVDIRLQISANTRSVAVIPELRLDEATDYTLQASGLRDAQGGLVVVPVTSFRTLVEVPDVVDTDPIEVTLPEGDGNAHVVAPPGSLDPGSTVLITNEGNGHVVSCSVGNGGELDCEIPASIDDTLVISITDLNGNTITLVRGQYRLPDGRTAVGPAGGLVTGEGGVELHIPEDALSSGTIFDIKALGPDAFAERPLLAEAQFGGILQVQAQGDQVFRSEIDLAFPKPAGAPDGAFYYVYRRLEAPEGQTIPGGAAFEVIDHAFVQGQGQSAKVVTASCPFPGFVDMARVMGQSLATANPFPMGAIGTSAFLLMWTFDAAIPNVPGMGIIRGRVLRPSWIDPITQQPRAALAYDPISNAIVSGRDASGQAFAFTPMTVARTQADGSYTLWDEFPTEGQLLIAATDETASSQTPHKSCPAEGQPDDPHIRCVRPVQEVVAGCNANAAHYRNQVKANITFPLRDSDQPVSAGAMQVRVMREVQGQRRDVGGFAITGQPLLVGFTLPGGTVLPGVEIESQGQGQTLSSVLDPTGAMQRVVSFTPSTPGVYVVRATGHPLPAGPAVIGEVTFRAVVSGGDAAQPIPGRPRVVSGRTLPPHGEVEVSTAVFPEVVFTEPVWNLPGHARLVELRAEPEPDVDIEVDLVGIDQQGNPVEITGSTQVVTSVTLQPRARLDYGTEYRIVLDDQIKDLDTQLGLTDPNVLEPFTSDFETLAPKALTDPSEDFSSSGIASVGKYAFLVENRFQQGILRVFDVSDPRHPLEVSEGQKSMAGRPMDIAAQPTPDGWYTPPAPDLDDIATVVAITGPTDVSMPSNLRIYRIERSGRSRWVGAASLTSTALEGIAQRVTLHGAFAYTTTTQRGVQVVDLAYAQHLFDTRGGDSSRVRIPLNSDGQGFGQEAVVASIPVLMPPRPPPQKTPAAFLSDLKVMDLVDGFVQPIVLATGDIGLAAISPQNTEVLFPVYEPPGPAWERPGFIGRALDVTRRGARAIAVVAGEQGRGGPPTLLTVDVTNPRHPRVLGSTELPQRPVDVVILDGLVLVGGQDADLAQSTTAIVNIDNLDEPELAGNAGGGGEIADIGGRLAVSESGYLLGTMPSSSGGTVELGGVRTATLGVEEALAVRVQLQGGRTSVKAGEQVQAIARTRPTEREVTWELAIDRVDVGVRADIDVNTGLITADPDSASGFATITARLKDDPQVFGQAKVQIGCNCKPCEKPGFCEIKQGSINAVWSLGLGARGESAGNLFLRSSEPSASTFTPAGLEFSSLDLSVERIVSDQNRLRQVVAPQTLVDIVELSAQSYELRFYDASARGERLPEGHYQLNAGATATVVWKVESLGPNALRLTETRGGEVKHHDYEWNAAMNDWTLRRGDGETVEKRTTTIQQGTGDRVVRIKLEDKNGLVSSEKELTYRTFSSNIVPGVGSAGVFEEIVREVVDPNGAALTTIKDYWDTPNEPWRHRKLKSVVNPDGSWVRYDYGNVDIRAPGFRQIATETHGWLDAAPGASAGEARVIEYRYAPVDPRDTRTGLAHPERLQPRTAIEAIAGREVSRSYFAYVQGEDFGPREVVEERCVRQGCAYGASDNLRTVTRYYATNTGLASDGRLERIEHADGKLDTYRYEYETYERPPELGGGFGAAVRETVVHGTLTSPQGVPGETTREVSVTDERGQLVRDERFIYYADDSTNPPTTGYALLDWTRRSYDGQGRLRETTRSNGEVETATWGCCSEQTTTDSRGITTTVLARDGLERPLSSERAGVTTTQVLDADGRVVSTTRSGGGLQLSTRQSYDLVGRLVESTDEQGLVTRTLYELGGRKTTVTRPGGFTEIRELYADGQPKRVTGTAVVAQFFTYTVESDGTRISEVRLGRDDSPVFERTYTDVAGRVVRTERPGFGGSVESTETTYDDAGRVARTRTTGLADTLFEYDGLGERTRSGLDVDGNGVLELASQDRITESRNETKLINGHWWDVSEQLVYPTATPVVTSTALSRVTGLGGGLIAEQISRDIHGNETQSTVTIDRAARSETRRTDVPESNQDALTVSINGRLASSTTATGVTTTFHHDGLGRQIGATDPRTGTVTTVYDSATGRVLAVRDAGERATTFGYDPASGRKIKECNALGKCTYFEHSARGELLRTWGDVPYPVEYSYDQYGRRTHLRTFRDDTFNWAATTWPSGASDLGDETEWQYEEATGLLLTKLDAAGEGPTYTYEAARRLRTRTWARRDENGAPIVTTYGYSPKTGELLSVDYSDTTPDVTHTYDRLGRQLTVTDGTGSRVFAYDPNTLALVSETIDGIAPAILRPQYSTTGVIGRVSGLKLDDDYSVTYGYDPTGRFETLGWNVNGVADAATYSYVPQSDLLAGLATESGQTTTYGYEPTRNLKTQVQNRFDDEVISQFDYVNDPVGRRTSVKNSGSAFAAPAFTKWGYDNRNQLTSSHRYLGTNLGDESNPVPAEARTYDYDPIGNRKLSTAGSIETRYLANSLNQYSSIDTSAPEHDEDGNLVDDGARVLVYDAEKQLTRVEPRAPANGDERLRFTYDYRGRRISKLVERYQNGWTAGETTVWTYAGWTSVRETERSIGSEAQEQFVWGLDLSQSLEGAGGIGGLLSVIRPQSQAVLFSYDLNGNVAELISSDGGVDAHYEYDSFGNLVVTTDKASQGNAYRGSTKQSDTETGLSYFGYRYFDPKVGRWTQADPAEEDLGGENLFAMVQNDPVNAHDPLGLFALWEHERVSRAAIKSFRCTRCTGDWDDVLALLPATSQLPDKPEGAIALLISETFGLSEDSLTYRSHHGDMQIWHSMSDGQSTIEDLQGRIVEEIVANVGRARGALKEGHTKAAAKHLGYAVHAIQDSFSESHVSRGSDGAILQYQNYNCQVADLHAVYDRNVMGLPAGSAWAGAALRGKHVADPGLQRAQDATGTFLARVVCSEMSEAELTQRLKTGIFRHGATTSQPDPRFVEKGGVFRRAARRAATWTFSAAAATAAGLGVASGATPGAAL